MFVITQRQRLSFSPAENYEFHVLERAGAWEPMHSLGACKVRAGTRSLRPVFGQDLGG